MNERWESTPKNGKVIVVERCRDMLGRDGVVYHGKGASEHLATFIDMEAADALYSALAYFKNQSQQEE